MLNANRARPARPAPRCLPGGVVGRRIAAVCYQAAQLVNNKQEMQSVRQNEREREREGENRQLFALPQHNKLQGKMRAQLRARASEANNIIMLSSQRDGNTLDPKSKAKRESNSE